MAVSTAPVQEISRTSPPACLVSTCSQAATFALSILNGPGAGLGGHGCADHVRSVARTLPPSSTVALVPLTLAG